jgi:hypothetical protein
VQGNERLRPGQSVLVTENRRQEASGPGE